jgi:6,7-dimethyl-8-ribityllumazine synthase
MSKEEIRIIQGELKGDGLKFGIAVSRFNSFISDRLLEGALDCFNRHGVAQADITIVKAPGSFEIPLTAKLMAESGRYDAVICLGAIIRGATSHFDYVASETAKGIAQVGLKANLPVVFGVITAETLEQAIERAGTKAGNKGFDAAETALEMANLMKNLSLK